MTTENRRDLNFKLLCSSHSKEKVDKHPQRTGTKISPRPLRPSRSRPPRPPSTSARRKKLLPSSAIAQLKPLSNKGHYHSGFYSRPLFTISWGLGSFLYLFAMTETNDENHCDHFVQVCMTFVKAAFFERAVSPHEDDDATRKGRRP